MNSKSQSDVAEIPARNMRRAAPSSTNLPLVDERIADEELRALFAQYRESFGRADLPGIVLCFATNPALLKGMLEIAENFVFTDSFLNRRHKEMIATFVSQRNECPYCADSHGAALAMQGGSPEVICALREGELDNRLFTRAELALLKFVEKVNMNSSVVTRADVDAAMQDGWTEGQITEAVHMTALFAAFNRIANGFGLPSPFQESL
jgi:uncharacterized peroxidase-related enzyme